ncbi:MAG: aminopeptidase [Bacilli bacterium]|nr:aminopeptidase [Bacilli bacterium]
MYNKNAWEKYESKDEIFAFAEGYKDFITKGKTEREVVKLGIALAEAKGFRPLDSFKSLKPGDKVYAVNKNKNIAAFIIGEQPVENGLRVLGAHIDSPRIDVKGNPLYEKDGFALLDTHYYGGIKKYQWVTIPLAIYGVVIKKDGTKVEVAIGDKPEDPVVGITDLLIHLSADQMQKTAAKAIEGEDLDLTIGSLPLKGEDKEPVKKGILALLKDQYGIEEEDFLSAELEIVPAGPARDYGLDRSMVAGYGHDDRSCAYTSLMAVLDSKTETFTSCAVLVDKEEVGSIGATGAQSKWFENVIAELIAKQGDYTDLKLRKAFTATKMLSSDVSAGVDPIYSYATEPKNAAWLGKGLTFNKFTGSRGKGGCNDANPEYIAEIRQLLDDANIHFQFAELGKVDLGGGGTIAYILGNYNMNVIDAGIPVLNMHAPMEIVSKVDLFEAYKGYMEFVKLK